MKNDDAQELDRRQNAQTSLSALSSGTRENAVYLENAKIRSYEQLRKEKLQIIDDMHSPSPESILEQDDDRMERINVLQASSSRELETLPSTRNLDLRQASQGMASPVLASQLLRPTKAFVCEHPGCTAAPFQTQYLLK